jgi:hypothetical protein
LDFKRVEDPDVIFLAKTKLFEKELEKFRWMFDLPDMCSKDPGGRRWRGGLMRS